MFQLKSLTSRTMQNLDKIYYWIAAGQNLLLSITLDPYNLEDFIKL